VNQQGDISTKQMLILILIAYLFSIAVRMIWVWDYAGAIPAFVWNNEIMINTNDGYFFSAGAQKELYGQHLTNPRVFGMWDYGVIFFTVLFAKITPFSLDTISLYLPAVVSSLVVIPIILLGRAYGQTLWGFGGALLGAIGWSYYNRTMIGYYDTDMFSAMAPMFILYFLIKSTLSSELKIALFASIFIVFYPFLYDQGMAIVFTMGILYALYMLFYHRNEDLTYASLTLVFASLISFGLDKPNEYFVKLALVVALFFIVSKLQKKVLMILALLMALAFLITGDVYQLIENKVLSYTLKGTEGEGLKFLGVNQTVREAGDISFSEMAERISGSVIGVMIALIGYVVLVIKHRAFILALPLIGIGIFSMWGGLRFTVYAVPVAGMSAIYLFWHFKDYIQQKKLQYAFFALGTIAMLIPNIVHVFNYDTPTVFTKTEVSDLSKLDMIADSKDFVLTWWDFAYPIWYYSNTSTIIDGGRHDHDNYIISTLMLSTNQTQVANLSRLSVESYMKAKNNLVAEDIFKDKNPNTLLKELENPSYALPAKTRDVYLYMPYKMMGIFPTVSLFGNLDLTTGSPLREVDFMQLDGQAINDLDTDAGIFHANKNEIKIKNFAMSGYDESGKFQKTTQTFHIDGEMSAVYMQSYDSFVLMDNETFNSAFVQMFMLENYDHNLFELVVNSPYTKVFKVKK
jgi:dolichyl-diphosphooligosaccharide--protein glycosyltransferase/undecaprenyl-diphosphooligosaccharide--protein glycosyltransferase